MAKNNTKKKNNSRNNSNFYVRSVGKVGSNSFHYEDESLTLSNQSRQELCKIVELINDFIYCNCLALDIEMPAVCITSKKRQAGETLGWVDSDYNCIFLKYSVLKNLVKKEMFLSLFSLISQKCRSLWQISTNFNHLMDEIESFDRLSDETEKALYVDSDAWGFLLSIEACNSITTKNLIIHSDYGTEASERARQIKELEGDKIEKVRKMLSQLFYFK